MKQICQHYKYNESEVHLERMTEAELIQTVTKDTIDDDMRHWINFHSLEQRELIAEFLKNQEVDKMVLDDIYEFKKRSKVEEYENIMFFSIFSALPTNHATNHLEKEQLSFILGRKFLISLQQKKSDHFTEVRDRLDNKKGKVRDKGEDYLLFRLLDAIIDNYFEVLEDVTENLRRLEIRIINSRNTDVLKQVELQKIKLTELRKIVVPMREILTQLEKSENPLIQRSNRHYFSDLKDNCLVIVDDIDSSKSILEGMTNLHFAVQGQRMNEIMKVLTIVSSIFIPLTFIVGIYGMNFENMPELKYQNGYYVVLGGMAVLGILLFLFFIAKGWLKRK